MATDMRVELAVVTGQFLEYCKKELGHTPKTLDNYAREFSKLNRWGGSMPIEEIVIDDLNHYFRYEEERGLAISSVNTARHIIRSFFYYCQYYRQFKLKFDYGMIRQKKNNNPKKMKVASVKDVVAIVNALEDPQDKLIVVTLFDSGIRIGELVHLKVENFHDEWIEVKGKGNKLREIPISSELSHMLHDHIAKNNIITGPIFRHRVPKGSIANHGYTISGIRNRFIRKLSPFGLYPSFHWFRHGKATDLYENGADLMFIRDFLGHSDIRTTQIYMHVSKRRKRESYDNHYPAGYSVMSLLDNRANV